MSQYNIVSRRNGFPFINPQNEKTQLPPTHDDAKIELKGGSSPMEGNVFVNGKPVCDDLWDDDDATVACRMLGYYFILIDNHNFLYEGFLPAPTQSDPGLALCQKTTSWTM